jgi:PAS domain S-box-containing protein
MHAHPDNTVIQALWLAAIIEGSDDAIVGKDTDGVITSWNPSAERMFGYTGSEVVGRSIRVLIPPERQPEEDEVLTRVRRGERVQHFETVRVHRDGRQLDVSVTVSPVMTADGRIIGASTIMRDITDRRRAELALAEGRAEQAELHRRLMTIIDASGRLLLSPRIEDVIPAILAVAKEVIATDAVAVWRVESGTWRIAASRGLSSTFITETVSVTDVDRLDDMIDVERVSHDWRVAHRRSAYAAERIESLLTVPLSVGTDRPAAIVFYNRRPCSFTDVERESAAGLGRLASAVIATAQLYDNQRRSRFESEFLSEAGAILMSSRDYTDAVRRLASRLVPQLADWCAFHLQPRSEAVATIAVGAADALDVDLVDRLLRGGDSAPHVFSIDRVVRTGLGALVSDWTPETAAGGEAARAAAGQQLGVRSLISVPLVAHGRMLGVMTLVSQQETNRFGTPELRFAQELGYRVAVAIDNVLSYEDARNANRLKDEFLASLSHELRTPLNAIVGYAQMLKNGTMPPDRRTRAYEVLHKNASALTQIVEDVLDISRIVAGKIRLQLQPMALAPIVVQCVETVQPGADAKGVRLRIEGSADPVRVAGDPDRLQQVFWNLLSNAVKFTPRDGAVSVGLGASEEACEVTVADTGAGIDPQVLPHIFERFRQGDSRITREHGGLGLGLAIARQLVEMHGGTIHAESDGPGRGARFRVRLPALPSADDTSSQTVASPHTTSREE